MIFILRNPATHCPYRAAGRALTRLMGQGAISLGMLADGCERWVGAW